jgi:hypothetical protein
MDALAAGQELADRGLMRGKLRTKKKAPEGAFSGLLPSGFGR